MRILIISDTHSRDLAALSLPQETGPVDALFHAGDIESSYEEYESICADTYHIPFYAVAGNNDYASSLPGERILHFENTAILLTHGHNYRVSLSPDELALEAKAMGCSVAVYGHTHRPYIDMLHEVLMLNPGSISYPRSRDRRPTCILLDLECEPGEVSSAPKTRFRASLLYTDTLKSCGSAQGTLFCH